MPYLAPAKGSGRKGRQRAIKATWSSVPIKFGTDRLVEAYEAADEATLREGLGWYDNAHGICADIATDTGYTTIQVAGALAAFSPQTGWSENIRLTRQACEVDRSDKIGGHTGNACGKVSQILFGGHDPKEVLGGHKVKNFFRNVAWPDVDGPVTVDRHMVDLLAGKRGAIHERTLEKVGAYQFAAATIRSSARTLGIRPHQLQAVTWVHWRKIHDVKFNYDPKEKA